MTDRALELKLREDNGDTSAAIVPRERLTTVTPWDGSEIRKCTADLFYFIPCEALFSKSAQGFGQIRGAVIANSTRCFQAMIEHIFLQAGTIGGGQVDENPVQYPTWTVVPSSKDPRGYAGYLYRVIYTIPSEEVMGKIDLHLRTCATKEQTAVQKGQTREKKPIFQRFTYSEWVFMCDWYLKKSRTADERTRGFQNVDSIDNPYYPGNVFSLENALKLMRNNDAPAEFCQRLSYIQADDRISFPCNGEKTYLLCADQLEVRKLRITYLPHISRSAASLDSEEFRRFALDSGVKLNELDRQSIADGLQDMDLDSEAGAGNPDELNLEDVKQRFDHLTMSGDPESTNTLLGFKERVQKRMAEARKEGQGDPEKFAHARREAQLECLHWFFTDVFTTDETSDVGDALRALARWFGDFQKTNANFMMPNEKHSKNLSRFGDTQAQEAALGDTVWAIHVAHQEVASLRLASLHVYFYSPFHAHTCLLGAPGSGKSNAFQINNLRLIPDTFRDIGVESGKAKMTPGKKTDLSIETYEDIPPGQVGVSNQVASNGKAVATSNTDQESMLKYRLTKGRMKGVYKAVVNGVHTMVEVDSFCNTVMLIGMNAILSQIPKSISNRFNNIQFQTRTRLDSNGEEQNTASKFAHLQNRKMTPVRNSILRRDRRNQCFHAIIQLLVWSGVFVLNMAVPWLIWSKCLLLAKAKGLQETAEVRHFERLQFHGETLVVADAIDRVLDSGPESPLDPSKKFRPDDIIHFEKHLYGNTEHASFSLGLLQHQYENPIIHAVEKFLKELLKDLIKDKAIGRKPPSKPSSIRASSSSEGGSAAAAAAASSSPSKNLDNYYYISKIDGLPLPSGLPDPQRLAGNIQRLQRQATRTMSPRPQADEITHALECLAALQVEVMDPVSKKKFFIPALMFSTDGDVMVAELHMSNYTPNRMQVCLSSVLSHKYTKQKNFLYGKTKEKYPNIYQTVHIKPDPANQLVMEQSSYFSSAVLKMTHNAVKGVSASEYDRKCDELQEDEAMEDRFNGLFSDSPHKDVDMDLDDWASRTQCETIGLRYFPPTPDAPDFDTTPDALMRVVKKRLGDQFEQLEIYPLCFKELTPIDYKQDIAKDKAQNPDKYSLRATVGRGQKRKAIPEDDEEEKNENVPPNEAASAAAASMIDENEDESACNEGYFYNDHEDEQEEEEEEVANDEEDQHHVIPPAAVLLHGGPNGGPLPQAWNEGARQSEAFWDDQIAHAAIESVSSYRPLPVGKVVLAKRPRVFSPEEGYYDA